MTRDEAMVKLLAVEPDTMGALIAATGWPARETLAVVERLVQQRRVTYREATFGLPRLYRVPGYTDSNEYA